ncbi:MAG: hypothetical protein HXY34_01335 [Candidatus Thorarchaeota archaeon]|nr:hypothetical protein [Candidatus Thorarchaeota archaeon]
MSEGDTIATTAERDGDDGRIRVMTALRCIGTEPLVIESVWVVEEGGAVLRHADTALSFFGLRLPLRYIDTPMSHVHKAEEEVAATFGRRPSTCPTRPSPGDSDVFFLGHGVKGYEVFLDPISATYWCQNEDNVQKASIDDAKAALKVDGQTVIESARSATAAAWDDLDLQVYFVLLARRISDQLGKMGLGADGIRSARHGVQGLRPTGVVPEVIREGHV